MQRHHIKSSGHHIDWENNKVRMSAAHLAMRSKNSIFIFPYELDLFYAFIYEKVREPKFLPIWKSQMIRGSEREEFKPLVQKKGFRVISIDVLYHCQGRF
jgi:hypothetical protein